MASIQKHTDKTSSLTQPSLVHWNPLLSLQKEMDKALHGFYDLFESRPFKSPEFEHCSLAPLMDLIEDANGYKLEVEMPGMDEKDIKISLNDNLLTIKGEKTISTKDNAKSYIAREITYGSYERSITLPQSADPEKATATFKKGMLWINIPKRTGRKGTAHQIPIQKA
jgi:HSP20 family protein